MSVAPGGLGQCSIQHQWVNYLPTLGVFICGHDNHQARHSANSHLERCQQPNKLINNRTKIAFCLLWQVCKLLKKLRCCQWNVLECMHWRTKGHSRQVKQQSYSIEVAKYMHLYIHGFAYVSFTSCKLTVHCYHLKICISRFWLSKLRIRSPPCTAVGLEEIMILVFRDPQRDVRCIIWAHSLLALDIFAL